MTRRAVHLPVAAQSSIEDLLAVIEAAERGGYSRAWMPETWGRDAVSILAVASEHIDTIGLGTSIVNVYSRTPALLGQTAVTLAELVPSSFRLGLGPSGPAVIERWHGVEYDRPLRRTRETTEIVRQVTSGSIVDYDGEIFQLEGFRLRCEPPTTEIPIDLAGLGPTAVELAGFIGDGWHALLSTPDGLSTQQSWLETGLQKSGRARDEVDVTLSLTCCALPDGSTARRLASEHIAFYTAAMGPFYQNALARQGYEDLVTDITQAWHAGQRAHAAELVEARLLDEIAVAGTHDAARARLERFAAHEVVDTVAISFPRGATLEQIHQTLDALAPDGD